MKLLRALISDGNRVFTVDRARDFATSAGLSPGYLRQALHHLTNAGWLVRLRKGLYAVSTTVPGVITAHEFEVAMALTPLAAISHWSALHYHGLTDQAPRKVFILTTTDAKIPQVRGRKQARHHKGISVGTSVYQFVRVKPDRFFGTQKIWINDVRITITDPERTLLDGLMIPQYCGDFAEVLHAFQVQGTHLDVKRIIDYALRLDAATVKRLGWVLEHAGVTSGRLKPLMAVTIKGYRKLDPTGPRKGPCDHRWMIQNNLPGR